MDEPIIQNEKNIFPLGISNSILISFVFITIFWYLKLLWDKRKLITLGAKIQGPRSFPFLGSYSNVIWGILHHGDSSKAIFDFFWENFEKYPDIFKFWLGYGLFIGIKKPEYLEIILNHPKCIEKAYIYKYTRIFLGDGLLAAPIYIWKKHRKLINPTFNQQILNSFVSVFTDKAKILASVLEEKVGEKHIDIFPLVSDCNLDTVCDTMMGIDVRAQSEDGLNFGTRLDRGMEITLKRMFMVWYQNDLIFRMTSYHKEIHEHNEKLSTFTNKIVVDRREEFEANEKKIQSGEIIPEDSKKKTFLDLLLRLNHKGEKLTDDELRDEVNTFVAAGSDTTAAAICFCLLTLGMFPEFQKKVYNEMIDVFGSDNRDVLSSDLSHLQYTERFIKETLRFFPIAPYYMRHAQTDIDLGDGVVLPKNTNVVISAINLHRKPGLWKNPLEFNPDNFLPEEISKRHPYSYIPFSAGPRGCIGSRYAMMAMKTILATIMRKFIIECDYKSIEDVALKMNVLLRPVDGFKVSFKLRNE